MNGDLGEQTARTVMDATVKGSEVMVKLLEFLLNRLKKDYDAELKKAEIKEIKARSKEEKLRSFKSGKVRVEKMQKSGESISYAKYGMTKEQVKEFNFHAKQRGIPIAWIQNGHDKNTFLAVFRAKDSAAVEDITAQLIRDSKITAIEDVMKEKTHYQKMTFDHAVNELSDGKFEKFGIDPKMLDPRVFVCERTKPSSYMEVSSKKAISDKGTPYVSTEFKIFKDGKQQKCDEFKHGRFEHWSDNNGKNTSEYGDEHWLNMKTEMREKGEFSDDLLLFTSEEDYKNYVTQYQTERAEAEKDSEFYNKLSEEKEKIIRKDVDGYNDRQADALCSDMRKEMPENPALKFDDTVDRFQCNGWSKENPYYICNRTDPDTYMEVNSEPAEFHGEEYTRHSYNIYADGKQIANPAREDGQWTDERFEGRPVGFWKQTKAAMKSAGKFTDDLVAFSTKEEMLEYQKAYELQKSSAKESTLDFETDKEGFNKDFDGIVNKLKSQMQQFNDIGEYKDGVFAVSTGDNFISMPDMSNQRLAEAVVISEQIKTFEKMRALSNEIARAELQMQINEKSELKESGMYADMQKDLAGKIEEMKKQMRTYENTADGLAKNREQIAGIKAERDVTDKDGQNGDIKLPHSEEVSMEQLRDNVAKTQPERGNTQTQRHEREKMRVKDEKER